ncbi:MAG: PAS domain S-box protein, partial [Chlorobiales bacterium]|nr:PAS domain S-box protein [Chlorobiales bacterium]
MQKTDEADALSLDKTNIEKNTSLKRGAKKKASQVAAERQDCGKPGYCFSYVMDALQEGFVVLDNRFKIKEVNPAYCRMTGYSTDELLGMHISELDTTEAPEVTAARIKRIISNGSEIFETWHRRKDGSIIELEISTTFQSEKFSGWSLICFCRNISGRKRSEAESAARVAISGIFQRPMELSETYQKLAECLVSTLHFPMASISMYDAMQGEMVNVGISGIPNLSPGTRFPVDQLLSEKVAMSGQGFYESFASKRPEPQFEPLRQFAIETLICVPLRISSEVIGTITIADHLPRHNAPSWVSNLATIATTLAQKIKRKQAEQALRESEELHRSILDASPDGIAISDLAGNLIKVSPAILKIFGYIREDKVLGRSLMEFIVPEDRERAQYNIGLMLQGIFTGPAEYQVIRADGSVFYSEVNAKFTLDANDQATGLVFVIRDITERKDSELALAEETIRRHILFEKAKDGIVILNSDFSVIESNKAFADMLGYTIEEMKQLCLWDWEACYPTLEDLQNAWPKPEKHNFTFETKHRRKDGSTYDAEISLSLANWNGQELAYCVCRDITERKESERALAEESIRRRILFEQAKDGIVVLGNDFSVVEANYAFADMLGYTPEEMSKLYVWDWDNVYQTREELFEKWPQTQEKNYTFETKHRRKDGSVYDVEISMTHVELNGQQQSYCICRDITERNKAREALQESEEKLRLFIEHAPASLAMLDHNLCYIYASSRWFSDFEIENQDIIGRSHYEVFPEIPERWKEVHRRALAGEVLKNDEDRFVRQNGNVLWRRWEVRPWHTTSGEVGGIIILSEDITERKKASEAMQESEKRFATIFETSPAAIGISRLDDGMFIQINPAFARLIGYSRDEIIGHNSTELQFWELPHQRAEILEELIEKKRLESVEMAMRHKNGEIRNILGSFELVELSGILCLIGILTDITESKKAMLALRESEARYRLISENTGDVIWMFDLEKNHFIYVSPSVERVFGFAPEEIPKQTLSDRLTPDSMKYVNEFLPKFIQALESGDETARTTTHEVNQLSQDGSIVPTEIVTTLVQNNFGKVSGIIGVTREITKRKRAEIKLKESEERFKLTFYTSPDSISISKLETGEYVEVNEGFCQLTGYSREEVIGKTSVNLNIWQNSGDRSELISALKGNGSNKNFEGIFRRKDGVLLTGFMSAKIITFDGAPHLIAITRDVTERNRAQEKLKESEERLRALIETTPDWIWEVDSTGHYTYSSSKVKEILGYTPQEIYGHTPFEFMPEEEAQRVGEAFSKIVEEKKPFTQLENINLHRDGQLVVLETSGVPVFDVDGKLVGYRGMDRNITERKRAEKARRQWADAFMSCGHGIAMGNPTTNNFLACNPAFVNM